MLKKSSSRQMKQPLALGELRILAVNLGTSGELKVGDEEISY